MLVGLQADRPGHHHALRAREAAVGLPEHLRGALRAADHGEPVRRVRIETVDALLESAAVDDASAGQ
nr:hypothetical protein [Actinomadura madurae]